MIPSFGDKDKHIFRGRKGFPKLSLLARFFFLSLQHHSRRLERAQGDTDSYIVCTDTDGIGTDGNRGWQDALEGFTVAGLRYAEERLAAFETGLGFMVQTHTDDERT